MRYEIPISRELRALIIVLSASLGLLTGAAAAVARGPAHVERVPVAAPTEVPLKLRDGRVAWVRPGGLVFRRGATRRAAPPGTYRLEDGGHAIVDRAGRVTLYDD